MQEKENVYGTESAEGIAAAKAVEATERIDTEEASAALGKFKDVNALKKAYGCLQAEFTRRSQKLKQLQKRLDSLEAEKTSAASGVEKLREYAERRRAEEEKFDDFISDVERANVRALSEAEEIRLQPSMLVETPITGEGQAAVDETPVAGENVEAERSAKDEREAESRLQTDMQTEIRKPAGDENARREPSQRNAVLTSDDLYERVKADERVRLKLIGEYLSSIGKSGAPLICGGAGALATPPRKAKTVCEAGDMALYLFKNGGKQA